MRLERSKNTMEVIKKIFCTWEGWSEIGIPAAGAIIIPLLILGLTWFFGASRAERIAEKQKNEENLIYLRSLLVHALKDFLMFRNNILSKRISINNYQKLTFRENQRLFAVIHYNDVYTQFEPKEYATLSRTCPKLVFNLLQTKTLMQHIYNRMENFNQSVKEPPKDIPALVRLMHDNLITFQSDINSTIFHIHTILKDIDCLEKKLKFQLVDLKLEDFEKQELQEALAELNANL